MPVFGDNILLFFAYQIIVGAAVIVGCLSGVKAFFTITSEQREGMSKLILVMITHLIFLSAWIIAFFKCS